MKKSLFHFCSFFCLQFLFVTLCIHGNCIQETDIHLFLFTDFLRQPTRCLDNLHDIFRHLKTPPRDQASQIFSLKESKGPYALKMCDSINKNANWNSVVLDQMNLHNSFLKQSYFKISYEAQESPSVQYLPVTNPQMKRRWQIHFLDSRSQMKSFSANQRQPPKIQVFNLLGKEK